MKDTAEKFSDYIGVEEEEEELGDGFFAPRTEPLPEVMTFERPFDAESLRLDKFLATEIPQVSRARIQSWSEAGAVEVNGAKAESAKEKTAAGDTVVVHTQPLPEESAFEPEDGIDFETVYEDHDIIVINKPAGLVVHPAAGHWTGTL